MHNLLFDTTITAREGLSVDLYFFDIATFRVLTADEEAVLAVRIKNRDKEALDCLVRAKLCFVIFVAKKYQHQGLALIKAAWRFDETKGFKFLSYAIWWIGQSIMAAITEHARMIRLPQNRVHEVSMINKVLASLEQGLMHEPSPEQLAFTVGCDVRRISEALLSSAFTQSYERRRLYYGRSAYVK